MIASVSTIQFNSRVTNVVLLHVQYTLPIYRLIGDCLLHCRLHTVAGVDTGQRCVEHVYHSCKVSNIKTVSFVSLVSSLSHL